MDFAHIVVPPVFLAQRAVEEFGRDPRDAVSVDRVGAEDPALSGLFSLLLRDLEAGVRPSRLYGDSFRTMFEMALLRGHTPSGQPQAAACHKRCGLAGWQLRRVLDRMEAAVGRDTPLSELTGRTGLSRSQFFRAFRRSTGTTPHRHLTGLRMERAKAPLRSGQEPTVVFSVPGYAGARQFAAAFRRHTGLRPKEFLRATQQRHPGRERPLPRTKVRQPNRAVGTSRTRAIARAHEAIASRHCTETKRARGWFMPHPAEVAGLTRSSTVALSRNVAVSSQTEANRQESASWTSP